ncbi:MAG: MFS transporter [Pseudomonadota bacterium]|nr:MFS transporter [Pseudomonadota bacterium]
MADHTKTDGGFAWLMVGVAFAMQTLAFGGIGAVGVFLKPLVAEFGWSRGDTAAGYSMVALSAAAFGIFWGWLADRKGGRNIAVFGVAMMGISYFALSYTGSLWYYYLLHFAFGALGNSAVGTPLFATVGYWFTRNQGLAIGLMAAGGAFGQAVVPFAARLLISAYDWQTAYMWIGIAFLAIGLPLAMLLRDPPSRAILAPGAVRAAPAVAEVPPPVAPSVSIPFISAGSYFCCICMSVPIVHTVALVSDRGFDPEQAAGVLAALMIAGIAGRILGGKLADMIGPVPGWMVASFGQTALVFAFPFVDSLLLTYLLAIVFGVFYSADMSSILVTTRMLIPAKMAASAMGVVVFFGWLGMGTGAWLGGYIFDVTGSYTQSYAVAAAGGIVNLVILALFRMRLNRSTPVGLATA